MKLKKKRGVFFIGLYILSSIPFSSVRRPNETADKLKVYSEQTDKVFNKTQSFYPALAFVFIPKREKNVVENLAQAAEAIHTVNAAVNPIIKFVQKFNPNNRNNLIAGGAAAAAGAAVVEAALLPNTAMGFANLVFFVLKQIGITLSQPAFWTGVFTHNVVEILTNNYFFKQTSCGSSALWNYVFKPTPLEERSKIQSHIAKAQSDLFEVQTELSECRTQHTVLEASLSTHIDAFNSNTKKYDEGKQRLAECNAEKQSFNREKITAKQQCDSDISDLKAFHHNALTDKQIQCDQKLSEKDKHYGELFSNAKELANTAKSITDSKITLLNNSLGDASKENTLIRSKLSQVKEELSFCESNSIKKDNDLELCRHNNSQIEKPTDSYNLASNRNFKNIPSVVPSSYINSYPPDLDCYYGVNIKPLLESFEISCKTWVDWIINPTATAGGVSFAVGILVGVVIKQWGYPAFTQDDIKKIVSTCITEAPTRSRHSTHSIENSDPRRLLNYIPTVSTESPAKLITPTVTPSRSSTPISQISTLSDSSMTKLAEKVAQMMIKAQEQKTPTIAEAGAPKT
jgi:hypothetical protein